MKKYTHLLFDLDHTLWDFDANCKKTLSKIHSEFELDKKNISFKDFHQKYLIINNKVWDLYNKNRITKDELRNYRFNELLNQFDINDPELATQLEFQYLDRCPKTGILIPYAKEIINQLYKKYHLSIITNGFQKTQETKLTHSDLSGYFKTLFTSESVGYKKPDTKYFEYVIDQLKTSKENCLVIGDNPNTDIKGATDYGIDTVWINTQSFPKTTKCTYYFKNLKDISILF